MFGTINSVLSSVFGVTPVQTEAEINAMFDAVDNKKPTPKRKPVVAKPKTKPLTKGQKRRAKAKARKEAKATTTATPKRKPTVDTPHHHEPMTTVTHTSVIDRLIAKPAAITTEQRGKIIEILHAATVA